MFLHQSSVQMITKLLIIMSIFSINLIQVERCQLARWEKLLSILHVSSVTLLLWLVLLTDPEFTSLTSIQVLGKE